MLNWGRIAPGGYRSFRDETRRFQPVCDRRVHMTASVNPAAPHYLPAFFSAPGETDVLMVVMAVFLVLIVLMVGILFLRLHTLPERIAHKSRKLQFEIVAVL